MNRCKNCDTPLDASYCPQCGQKDLDLERSIWRLLAEVFRETFDVDGRALRTIRTLFARPGMLTARFLAGHRRQYSPPVRLYLFTSVLFFFVVAWTARAGLLFDVNAESAGEVRVLAEDLPVLMFVFLPVFALLLKILYRQRLYFDHLIHALHLHTAAYVVLGLTLPFEQAAGRHLLVMAVHAIMFVYLGGYLAVSLRRVYGATWIATLFRGVLLYFGYATILAFALEFASDLTLPFGA